MADCAASVYLILCVQWYVSEKMNEILLENHEVELMTCILFC